MLGDLEPRLISTSRGEKNGLQSSFRGCLNIVILVSNKSGVVDIMTGFRPRGWDELFEKEANRWVKPNEYAHILVDGLRSGFQGEIRVLDVGYGTGRHLVYLHRKGFRISGFEITSNAQQFVDRKLSHLEGSRSIELRILDMHQIPWPYGSSSFKGVLAINVIHHTNYEGFVKIINEIARIVVPKGLLLATIASKHNHKYGKGKQIDDYSYLADSGAEKGIPHAFFDRQDLYRIFGEQYDIRMLEEITGEIPEADKHLRKEGIRDHWLIYAERK